jgi:hypothetical protein
MQRWPGLAALGLFICLAAGCGPTFTYNHLDQLIPWYVDGYVDLSRDQRAILRGQLEPLLQWHREEELVHYAGIIDRIGDDLSRPVTPTDVQRLDRRGHGRGGRSEETMLALALDFGATASDAQWLN